MILFSVAGTSVPATEVTVPAEVTVPGSAPEVLEVLARLDPGSPDTVAAVFPALHNGRCQCCGRRYGPGEPVVRDPLSGRCSISDHVTGSSAMDGA